MAAMTMEEWLREFCGQIGVDLPTEEELAQLLELAAIAAHGSERPAAPVACWAAGKTDRSPGELLEIAGQINPS
jgi:Domain of unknown function (DUF6457)